jgi:N-acetyl-gamma-glutamyl-phosphate reductase
MKIGIVGASGYAGAEVLRLAAQHPELEIAVVTGETNAGKLVSEVFPTFGGLLPTLRFSPTEAIHDAGVEVAFLALPHGHSQGHVQRLIDAGVLVVDLGADFRLRDASLYDEWYHAPHTAPSMLASAVYGLVERHRSALAGATLIAAPGCYPTATALAVGPFVDAGIIHSTNIVVNALSGVSGAGRAASERLQFSRLASNAELYGVPGHRHTPEIEQEVNATVLFLPHLVPAARGMLVTATASLVDPSFTTEQALSLLHDTYVNDLCVVVQATQPSMKDPVGSNLCFLTAFVDKRTATLVVTSAIDNLGKGAAGQAIQAFNVSRGWPETLGLSMIGVTP